MDQIFIAREQQLKQLSEWLAQAVAGHGQVSFVSGEAGSGKSTLVNEFIKRAQKQDKDLAAAVGLCDAQTGLGDAYLPFREVMGQLTGDVDAKLAQGAITQENAGRLKNMLVLAGQAIVDVGPDLIGVFVPGVGLATKLGTFVAEKVGWLEKLEKLVNKPKEKLGESGIQESHIFEQYANVLCRISEKNPLLIILDDLHWADAASINLLFHLGRRIGEHRIMILGTYRSAEVAIGRGGERHPLEKVLAEFKRYFGEIILDLDQAVEEEGRSFVAEFLGTEPNKLDEAFKDKLYEHTGGHPLFTVELLRNIQERGDLVKDQEGLWIESQYLDWNKLPTKVEGVIEERIGRLQAELKEVLTVGSVQGEDFTAEVVARVQQAEAGGLIRKLSGELERQHRLVHGEGIRRLDPGGQRLSLFRFQHNLFRSYLYNELSEAERVYLHEDVGRALEALYAEQADEIAVLLALHFERAGVDDKARHYLQKAGEQAAERYANEEAIEYFTRALEMTPETELEKRYELLLLRESIYSQKGDVELQQQDIDTLMDIVYQVNNEHWLAEVLYRKSQYNQRVGDFQSVVEIANDLIRLSDVLHDNKVKIRGHLVAGVAETSRGNQEIARDHLVKSLELASNEGRQHEEMQCLRSLSSIEREQSNFDEAITYCKSALELAKKNYERIEESKILIILGNLSSDQGNESKARFYYDEALPILKEVGSRPNEAILLSNMGCTYANKGDYRTALPYFEQARKISHDVGYREMECVALGNLGELSASLGDFIEAKNYFNEALEINREIGYKFSEMIVLSQLGQIFESLGEYSLAREYLEKSLLLTIELESKEWEVKLHSEIGRLLDAAGLYNEANEELIKAIEITKNFDVKSEECDAWAYRGLLLHHLNQNREAETSINKALNIANGIDVESTERFAYLHLGNVLTSLENYDKARDCYSKCIKMANIMGQTYLIPEIQAGQARVAVLEGKLDEAMKYIEQILDYLKNRNLVGTDEPMRIYLTCCQVLQAVGDPRADEIITQAHSILEARANKITDDVMRQSYLENVEANLAVLQAYHGLS